MSFTADPKRKVYKPFERGPYKRNVCFGESMTQQHFKDQCDINHMMKKYQKTGILGDPNRPMPRFGDFSGSMDFHEANNRVVEALQQFNDLPGELKKRFRHDPGELIDFLENEENREEAIKLGLVDPKKEESPEPTPAAEPPSGPPKAAEEGKKEAKTEESGAEK